MAAAFAALDRGAVSGFRELFVEDTQWPGVSGMGYNGGDCVDCGDALAKLAAG